MSSYLVTGAAGFIGSAVARKLISEGNDVVTIDNLSTGNESNIPKGCEFIRGSVSEEIIIKGLENRKFDGILHIAGQSSGEISFENPVYDMQTNCQSTILLLDFARKIGCNNFLYASSMSVYGEHNSPKCDEETTLIPKSFYAVGKVASEHYMRIYCEQFGITCTSLRLFNTYGPGQNMNNLKQGMISIYLAMALKDRKIVVRSSKDRFRDFVYIDDVVNAFIMCLNRKSGYECFNVCTGVKTTVEQVINHLRTLLQFSFDVEYDAGTPGDQFGIFGDNNKIKNQLNWRATMSFGDGIQKMIEWAKNR